MENNKNILRYASCAGFGICLLIQAIDFISFLGNMDSYYRPVMTLFNYLSQIAAFALLIAAQITLKQMLLVAGGGIGALSELVSLFPYLNFFTVHYDYHVIRIFNVLLWLGAWIAIILIGLKGKQQGKILGIIGGAAIVISRIITMVLNNLSYGGGHYSPQFYLYTIGLIAGIVLLGLAADSFPFAESAAIGASGKYGAGAPNRQYRQYRRYDASAPGGAGQQNYQGPGGGPAPYNYQGPGGAGQQNYQGPGGGPAPYNYQGAGQQNYQAPGGGAAPYNYQGAGQQNYQAPGGGSAPYNYQGAGQQNYQAPGGGAAPYNYQGAGQQNYQAPDGGSAPYNYQAPDGGAAPQNNTAPDGGAASDDYSAQDSASPFSYYPGGSDDDSSMKK